MIERLPGLFEEELHSDQKSVNKIKIFIIKGKPGERSLMIDAGFRDKKCLAVMEDHLRELGIREDELDIFLTHKHHDHCGLASEYAARGARLFMNPQEDRHCYDCLYYHYSHGLDEEQPHVLTSAGVTKERTPQIWDMFMEVNLRVAEKKGWEFEIPGFPYTPVGAGQILTYGDYELETVALKGHTFGQMGLYDRKKRVFFCADQAIDGIVPIVATSYGDEHLLRGYFDSLEQLKHQYSDCLFLPAHNQPVRDGNRIIDRIVFAYLDKTYLIKHILDHSHRRLTVKEVACLAYGIDRVPENESEFIKLKLVISKTFSCLEYLYDEDFVVRTEENGTYYWEKP